MSLILEALNRSRREQQNAQPVPGVDSIHYEPTPAQNARWWLWLPCAVALILALGFLLGRMFSGSEQKLVPETVALAATPASADAAVAPIALAPVASVSVAPVPAEPPQALALTQPPTVRAGVAAPPTESNLQADTDLQPDAPGAEGSAAFAAAPLASNSDVAALYARGPGSAASEAGAAGAPVASASPAASRSERAAIAPEASVDSSLDIGALAAAAEQALEDVRLAEHPAPFLSELSQQRKDGVPTLMYLQHDYRTEGGSTVTINGKKVAAGQPLGGGLRVEEVLPDSVVLSQAGQQFRLRALNSWVNL